MQPKLIEESSPFYEQRLKNGNLERKKAHLDKLLLDLTNWVQEEYFMLEAWVKILVPSAPILKLSALKVDSILGGEN